ncbi:dienelactone hydrolase family protein [Actinoplanes oblitus]|uniref:Dienelactone hydrolase family protein n=1 Tax=Actinoplanes oblitus TaxID=3040509 RepID=A0ABY8WVL1_9ACTN|nr:dienelactone hydrolase family protein [Actinoplanes oblitus]WIN00560.1 dienelactone hydrolase family protein [Actinoplanes oblitus]
MPELSAVHQRLVDTVPAGAGARIETATVAYEHDGQPLEGYVAHDAAITERKPAVVIVHDWSGLREYPKARAQMLARLGYYAFAADIYGTGRRFESEDDCFAEATKYYGDLPLLRARVRAAYDEVAKNPAVDPERIVVLGYCFGGSAALEFARTGAALRGAVSLHGRLIVHEPAEVDGITGSLLVLTGGADEVVPDSAIAAFQDELRTREDLDWQVNVYSGAPHAYTIAGTEYFHETADRRSWQALTAFLGEVLGR